VTTGLWDRAPRNRTIALSDEEHRRCRTRLVRLQGKCTVADVIDRTICQDIGHVLDLLPANWVDLLVVDPPYNLSKSFSDSVAFSQRSVAEYEAWLESWLPKLARTLKISASVYICGDWRSSAAIQRVAEKLFIVRNRITWEREKGRGSSRNWKNCSEDVWFCTVSDQYVFNAESVKLRRRVIAPYTNASGEPKDWQQTQDGQYRMTHASNLWTDLTVPFWSMRENTDHPTQKPEKLVAKIVLASSREGDVVLDPFLGSGTTSVVAKKLRRHYVGIEVDERYCCLAEHRLDLAEADQSIQGYSGGTFWERNTLAHQNRLKQVRPRAGATQTPLFPWPEVEMNDQQ
jgi:site-specific DNA-methyltransferase (adenine-specific)